MRKLICALCLTLSCSAQAVAQDDAALHAALVETCQSDLKQLRDLCAVYFRGVLDFIQFTQDASDGEVPAFFCRPATLTPEIAVKIWNRYVEENPEHLTDPIIVSLLRAMLDAYPPPCEN